MPAVSPKILVVRRRYLGDVVLLGPLFRNLRLHWPAAHLAALVEPAFASVLSLNPDVDETFELPRRAVAWPAFLARLRRARFTHVFDLDNNDRTALLARFTGAPLRVALWHEGPVPRWRALYTAAVNDPPAIHESRSIVDYWLAALAPAAVPVVTRELRLVPRADDLAAARRLFAGPPPGVLVHPGSRSPYRLWPADRFACVIDRVQGELGVRVALVGGPGERAVVADIARQCTSAPAVLDAPLSLPQLAALMSLSRVMLCHDSGPMHLAAAVGTRVVALFGSQNATLWRPQGPGHAVLQTPLPCTCLSGLPTPCAPRDSYRSYCVRKIAAEEAFAALADALR